MADVAAAVHPNNSADLAVAVADAVAQATNNSNNSNNSTINNIHNNAAPRPCPTPLPPGWVLKASQSNPGYFYYFSIPTGETSWTPPATMSVDAATTNTTNTANTAAATARDTSNSGTTASTSMPEEDDPDRSSKRRKPAHDDTTNDATTTATSSSSDSPKQVRVLHILKKHTGSRRPSSWRQAKITASIDEAKEELEGLLQVIQEEENPEDRQATFSELARTESDCTSAKRGGDLGFFGRRKMQPAFEDASFGLALQELSGIVETSSGVHLILRIG